MQTSWSLIADNEFTEQIYKMLFTDKAKKIANTLDVIMTDFDDNWMKGSVNDHGKRLGLSPTSLRTRLGLSPTSLAKDVQKTLEVDWSKNYVYTVLRYPVHNKKSDSSGPFQHAFEKLGDKTEGVLYTMDHEDLEKAKYFYYIFYLKITDRSELDTFGRKSVSLGDWKRTSGPYNYLGCINASNFCARPCMEYYFTCTDEYCGEEQRYGCCIKPSRDNSLFHLLPDCTQARNVLNMAITDGPQLELDKGAFLMQARPEYRKLPVSAFDAGMGIFLSEHPLYPLSDTVLENEYREKGFYHLIYGKPGTFRALGSVGFARRSIV